MAELLLQCKAEVPNLAQNTDAPLSLACRHGHEAVARVLLDNEAGKKEEAIVFVLSLACVQGYEKVARLLLEREARLSEKGRVLGYTPALHY